MNRAQIEAWLTLEGYVPYTNSDYWAVHNGVDMALRYHNGDVDWDISGYTKSSEDVQVTWADISSEHLADLYETLTRDRSQGDSNDT